MFIIQTLKNQKKPSCMLSNGYRGSHLGRQYLSPPKQPTPIHTLRNASSLNARNNLHSSTHIHPQSPRPMPIHTSTIDRDHSLSNVGQKMRMLKSKVNNLSIHSRNGLADNNLYPTELIFLLSNEEGNVQHMRKLVDEEKKRVNRDFDNFTRQIIHMIEDLKLSLHSQLDFVFRDFMHLYANMKNQVIQMRDNRKRIIDNLALQEYEPARQPPIRSQLPLNATATNFHNVSNLNLLHEISRDEDYFKNHRMYEQVTNAYFEAIGPIMMDAQNILTLGSQLQFYKAELCNQRLTTIRNSFFDNTRQVFESELDNIVTQTKEIIEDNNMLLKDLDAGGSVAVGGEQGRNDRSMHSYDRYTAGNGNGNVRGWQQQQHPVNLSNQNVISNISKKKRAETEANPYGFEPPTFKNNFYQDNTSTNNNNQRSRGIRPSSSSDQLKYRSRPESQWSTKKRQFQLQKQRQKYTVNTNIAHHAKFVQKYHTTRDQQNLLLQSCESPQFSKTTSVQCSFSQDILLCILFVNQGRNLLVGSKDRNIYVYSTTGAYKLVQTLSGHKASVCSMANFGGFFASGGDNGCSSLILWDPATWKIKRKVNLHSAALTCIVDLLDGTHLATGGYDKKINVYNYRKSQSAFEITSCRSGVASLVICEQTKKLVSAGLDSTLTIWKIFTKNGQVETITLERIITNCGLPCSLRSLTLAPDLILVGNKDGKILIVNVHTGQTVRTLSVGRGSVLEIGVIQRHSKPQTPLVLSCSNGQRQMILTRTDSGSCENTKVRINVGFGCGIGPKLIMDDSGCMAIVNQGSVEKEVTLYSVDAN